MNGLEKTFLLNHIEMMEHQLKSLRALIIRMNPEDASVKKPEKTVTSEVSCLSEDEERLLEERLGSYFKPKAEDTQ